MGPLSHYILTLTFDPPLHIWFTEAFFTHWHLTPLYTSDSHRDIFHTLTFDSLYTTDSHIDILTLFTLLIHTDFFKHWHLTPIHTTDLQRYVLHIDIWPPSHYWFTQIFFTHRHLTPFTLLIHTDIFYILTFDPLHTDTLTFDPLFTTDSQIFYTLTFDPLYTTDSHRDIFFTRCHV